MPLTRENVTAASRIMLPTYVIGFTWLGLGWALEDPTKLTEVPALRYANGLLPIHWWGLLLIVCGVIIAGALVSHNRTLCRLALWVTAIVMAVFVTVFSLAAIHGEATPGAPALFLIACAACIASERSLLLGERQ